MCAVLEHLPDSADMLNKLLKILGREKSKTGQVRETQVVRGIPDLVTA